MSGASGQTITVDYAVTGTATGSGTDYTLANGTLTINAGNITEDITIASIVDDVLPESNETVILTLSNPSNATLGTNTVHTYTINDNDAGAVPSIAFNAVASNNGEDTASADIAVDLSGVSGQTITVDYAVTGTATGSGTDYTLANGTLTINAGDLSEDITIASIVDDALTEDNETVILTLSNPGNATLGTNTVHTYTINDNDAANEPTIAFNSTASANGEDTASADIAVDLSGVSGQAITVDYAVTGTATGTGTDYTLANGTLTINAGDLSEDITIASIVDDALTEDNETVILTLSNPSNATLGTNTVHTYTINDNDAANEPTIAFNSTASANGEDTASADIAVDLSGVSGQTITVDYAVTGTATGTGTDYTLANGTLTINAGDLSEDITIASIVDDALTEDNETVILTLSNPSNATLGTNTVHTYTINDNDAANEPTIAFNSTASANGEDTASADIAVDLSGVSGQTITVDYAVTGTATGTGTDYTLANGTLTINAGDLSEDITIASIVDDALTEDNETVILTLSNPSNATLGTNTVHTYTINDNDAANEPTIAFNSTASANGEDTASADIAVDLSGVSGQTITVDYAVTGTATGTGTDYTLANGTLTINAGDLSEDITIASIVDDALTEDNETVILTLSNPSNATLGTNTVHTYTINDNDAANEPTIAFNSTASANGEDTASADIAVDLSGVSGQTITVDYAVTGTATGTGTDYTLANGTLTINAGDLSEDITIASIVDDALTEDNETVILTLSNPSNATLGTNTVHTYTINDNDAANEPTIAFNSTASANGEDTASADIAVDLSGVSGQTITVDYAVTGTATGTGTDYTLANGTLTINAGDLSEDITIASIVDDALTEDNETVILTLSNPSNATLGTNTVHTYTINDNDAANEPTIAFNSTASANGEDTASADIAVDLSGVSGQTITVDYAVTGTATGTGTDYTLANGTLTINAGDLSEDITIASIVDDTLTEDNETVILTLSNPSNATLGTNTVHTYTINDNDAANEPTIAFNSTASANGEDTASADIAVDLSGVSGQTITVDYAVTGTATGSGTDYTLANGTLTINAGDLSEDITIASIVDDALTEDNETVILTLSNPSNATLGTNTVHTYTINDNDAANEPTIAFNSTASANGEDTASADIAVDLSGVSGQAITVDYAVTGTATGTGTDYTLANGTLTINAGDLSEDITIASIVDDALTEDNETVILTLSNPSNATLGTNTVHTYTINDNDAANEPTIAFNSTASANGEDTASADIAVDLSGVSGQTITVDYAVTGTATGSGTDYTLANGTLTINAGDLSEDITIASIVDDALTEDNETVILTLSNPSNATLGTNTIYTYTINDNDAANEPTIAFNSTASANGEDTASADIAVDLSGVSGQTITVDYAVTGTATGTGTDYTLANGTLTINVGDLSEDITIASIVDDALTEDNETVILTLSNPSNATLGANTVHTYTINDNDAANEPTIAFNAIASDNAEDTASADIAVDLSGVSGQTITVDYAVTGTATGGGTDYTLANGTLTINAGSTSENITIAGIIEDALTEDDETVILTLSNPSNATLGANTVHTYTINDNDAANEPTIAFNAIASDNAEDTASADIAVDLSGVSGQTITVDYAVTGTATGGGTDYTLANGTLTINAGSTTENITIAGIIEDALTEDDETVILTLSNPSNATLGANTVHTYTINDNDAANEPTIAFNAIASDNGEDTASADIAVDLSGVSGQTITVDYAVTGTATGGGTDYTLANGTLTINAGSTTENITIAGIIEDALTEDDETVILTLSNPSNATLGANTVHTYTINDNDAANEPTIAFNAIASDNAEDTASADIAVDLSGVTGQTITVDYAVTGTATGTGTDYTLANGTLTINAGDLSEDITIASIVDDALTEDNETVILTLSNPSNATLGTNTVHTYTINDNDAANEPTIAFNSTASANGEDTASADIAVDLSGVSGQTITVDYAVTGTATGTGTDYTLANGTLTINAGDLSEDITIASIVDDTLTEDNETVILTLSNPSNATLGTNTVHTYTINDNDAANEPTIAFNSTASANGEDTASADIAVDLSGVSGQTITVDYALTGTATGTGTDYTLANGTLTINAGDLSEDITIASIVDDALTEDNETVILTLSNPSNATLGTNTVHTYTINDNDAANEPTIAFNSTASANGEDTASADIAVDLSGVSGQTITVDYAVTGTATGTGTDYTLANGTLTINAGDLSEDITIASIVDDALTEDNETVILTLSNPSNATLGTNTVHTYTINDNDAANEPTIAFNSTASANGEDTASADITVDLSGVSGQTITVDYAVTGTATGTGTDYTLANGTLTINAGDLSEDITIASIVDDALTEDNETVILTLSNPSNATLGTNTVHTYTINDNDAANEPTIAFNSTASANGEDTASAGIAVDLSGVSGQTITVDYAVTGTATGTGTDYTLANGTLTINAGDLSEDITIASIVDDALTEDNETVILTLSNPSNATLGTNTVHTYMINDNDAANEPTIAFNSTASANGEDTASADIAVDLSGVSGQTITVDYVVTGTATGSGTDYTLANGTLTINAGDLSEDITIASIVDDALTEDNETVILTLSNPSNATLGTNTVHTYTINDNDAANEPTIAFNSTASANGEDTASADIAVDLSGVSGQTITVDYAVTGTATGTGTDYTLANGTLTINAGDLSEDITIASIVDDALTEDNETVILTLSNPSNATLGTNTVHTYTINDNDAANEPTIAFNSTASANGEDTASADIAVDLSGVSGQTITVDYAVTGTATGTGTDYTLANGTLTINAGDLSEDITIASIVDDALTEDNETVILTLSNPSNATLGTNTVHTYTINDNDAANEPTIAFNSTASANGEDTASADIAVDLSGVSGQTITVDYAVTGTATGSGTDYTLANGTLTINAGDLSEDITIASIVDDALTEDNETVILTLSNPSNATLGTNTVHTYTINDNDAANEPTIAFNSTASANGEDTASADIAVDLSGVSGQAITVDYAVTGTATGTGTDYTLANGTLTINAGDLSEDITIASIVDDALTEDNETVILTLSNPSNATLGTNTVHTYTINDNDAANEPTIAFNSTASANGEDTASADIAVDLSGVSGQTITVDYAVTGTATGTGTDYTLANGTLTINAGDLSEDITIASIVDDSLVETNETVILTLSNPSNATLGANTIHTYTISDNDATVLTMSIGSPTNAIEGTDPVISFVVSLDNGLSNGTGAPITGMVTFSGTDVIVDAVTNTERDIDNTVTSFSIPDGQSNVTITVPVNDDTMIESLETVTAEISGASVGTINIATADATITDDDVDTDGDGATDDKEDQTGTDKNSACSVNLADISVAAASTGDCDGDGVTDADELNGNDGDPLVNDADSSQTVHTDPCSLIIANVTMNATDTGDCDNDGVSNADEINGLDNDYSIIADNTNPNVATVANDEFIAPKGSATTHNILVNDDFLPDGHANNLGTTTIVDAGTGDAAGTIAFDAATGEVSYTPDTNENGDVTIDYTVCNSDTAVCETATITVKIDSDGDGNPDTEENPNDSDGDGNPDQDGSGVASDPNPNAATVANDEFIAPKGSATVHNILANDDYLPNNDGLNEGTTTIVDAGTGDAAGTIAFDALTGEVSYTPDANENGDVTIDYTVCNSDTAVCETATITVKIDSDGDGNPDTEENANDSDGDGNPDQDGSGAASDPNPNAATVANDEFTAPKGSATVHNILANDDYLPNNDGLNEGTTTIVDAGTGDAAGTIAFDAATGEVSYTPDTNENGDVTIDYTVCNSDTAVCETATITVKIDSDGDGNPDTEENPNDSDGDGNPDQDGSGVASDPNPNAATVANDEFIAPKGSATVHNILANDDYLPNNDGLNEGTTTIVDAGTGDAAGTIAFDALTGEVSYTPDANENGDVTIDYTVCNSDTAVCETATITVKIDSDGDGNPDTEENANDSDGDGNPDQDGSGAASDPNPNAATVANDEFTAPKGSATVHNILANDDYLPNNDGLNEGTTTIVDAGTGDAAGTIAFDAATGEVSYTPDANENGDVTIDYTVCNSDTAVCETATITVKIDSDGDGNPDTEENPNDSDGDGNPDQDGSGAASDPNPNAATVSNDEFTAPKGSATVHNILANDDYLPNNDGLNEGTTTIVDAGTGDAAGTIAFDALTGEVSYTPDANENGDVTIDYTVCNSDTAVCETATITVKIDSDGDGNPDTEENANDSDGDGNPDQDGSGAASDPNPNAATVANDEFTAPKGSATVHNILANDDYLPNNDGLNEGTTTIVDAGTGDAAGTIAFDAATGEVSYTPDTNENGDVTIDYTVCNSDTAVCETATITVKIDSDGDGNPDTEENPNDSDGDGNPDQDGSGVASDPNPNAATVANDEFIAPKGSATVHNILANDDYLPNNDGLNEGTTTIVDAGTGDAAGTIAFDALTGEVSYTPDANENGDVTIDYTVCNSDTAVCETATITVKIDSDGDGNPDTEENANDSDGDGNPDQDGSGAASDPNPNAATVANDEFTAPKGSATVHNILANDDYLPNNDGLNEGTTTIVDAGTGDAAGTIAFDAATGEVSYTPDANENGDVTIDYTVCNSDTAVCETATITVKIDSDGDGNPDTEENPNDSDGDGNPDQDGSGAASDPNPNAATVSNDEFTAPKGSATVHNILANDDYLPNNDGLNEGTTTIVDAGTGTAAGTIAFDALTGEVSYTPDANENGDVTIDYTVCNSDTAVCETATITVKIDSDGDGNSDTEENPNDSDGDGNPDQDSSGAASDPNPNAATVANDEFTAPKGSATVHNILANDDYLPNNDGLNEGTTTIVDAGTGDAAGTIAFDAATGEVSYTPDANENGDVTIDYTVCNSDTAVCETATITVKIDSDGDGTPDSEESSTDNDGDGNPNGVDPNPDAPTVADDGFIAPKGSATVHNILANDDYLPNNDSTNEGNTTLVDAGTGTAAGTVIFNALTGEVSYTPDTNESGDVTIDYTVCNDETGVCQTATINIEIDSDGDGQPDNSDNDTDNDGNANNTDPNIDTPVAQDDTFVAVGGQETRFDILANDDFLTNANPDNLGNTSIVNAGTGTAVGALSFDPTTGEIAYTPGASESGTVTVDYSVCNIAVLPNVCASATVTIQIDTDGDGNPDDTDVDIDNDGNPNTGDPNPNVASTSPDALLAVQGAESAVDVLANDDFLANGTPGALSTITLVDAGTGTATGTIVFDASTGEFRYTPLAGETGELTVDYTVCNTTVTPNVCSTNTITISIDTDGDGIPDTTDTDDDGDGIEDVDEDPNGDGDLTNDDSDGDGIPDYLDPYDPNGDYDDDGVSNEDEDIDGDGNPNNDDTDGDGTPDYLDPFDPNGDEDNDGILNGDEDVDGDGNLENDDSDGDGTPDYLDPYDPNGDYDGDGISNEDEDLNGDGNPNNDDSDGDGTPDYIDPFDPDADDDNDGIDNGDEDTDGDGNPNNDDSDGDGTPDYLDPYDPDADDDNDGESNGDEDTDGDGNPNNDDSDEDGIPDYLDPENDITVYNTITPDGDGKNDTFVIVGLNKFENPILEVYNRWGKLVYRKVNYDNSWDGTASSSGGKKLPSGTYYYVIDLQDGSKPRVDWIYIN